MKLGTALGALAPFALSVTLAAQERATDRGQTFVVIAVPGIAKADEAALKSALDGTGVEKVEIDVAKKTATVRYDTKRTRSAEILARLVKKERFAAAQVERLGAELAADWARIAAAATVKKSGKGCAGAVTIQVDLKVENHDTAVTAHFPAGFKAEKPHAGKSDDETVFDFQADEFAGGEVPIEVGVKLFARSDARTPKRAGILVVPLVIP